MGSPPKILVVGDLPPDLREALERLPGSPEILAAADPASAIGALSEEAPDRRARLLEAANREADRASRYGESLAVALVGADGLEALDGAFGDAAVDALLSARDAAIRRSLRKVDLPHPFERGILAALLPHTPREGAVAVGERLRRLAGSVLVKAESGEARPGLPLRASASVGLSVLAAGEVATGARLLEEARASLEAARAAGGNRVGPLAASRR